MARVHGSQYRIFMGGRDVSDELTAVDLAAVAETQDRTTFADAGWRAFHPGLRAWEGSVEGFYDQAAYALPRVWETALGDAPASNVLSAYEGAAGAVGDKGILTSPYALTRRATPITVGNLVALRGTLRGNGRLGMRAVLLRPNLASPESATGQGTSVDNAASSPDGGRANLHAQGVSGLWTVKIQHSTDNSAWSDLVTFAPVSATGAESKEVSGTVNRYLRATWTEDSAGQLFFVVGFARYP